MFKFYTIPTENLLDKLIGEQASIKLSSAFNLNDPYELKFNLTIDPLEHGHEEQFYKNNLDLKKEDFENWQKNNGSTWYIEQEQRNAIAQTISLCSFTESNDNNLMWSHYTNNHTGICVEYKIELFEYLKKLKGFLVFSRVKYSEEPPTVNSLEKSEVQIEKIMFNKQSEWNYEKEFRIIFICDKDTEYISIDRKFIRAVYIGSRTEPEIEKKILSLCEETNIEVNYAITVGKSYKINFEKHTKGKLFQRTFWK
ncbi:DUF2971 domain-containing protein [Flavobacterium tyrosinilyticum]|uniref:DUF2971 domain-containing protein n=1 Tax=Flavobacterium tyrosinilyticum TaxID=1658740 RepID=UPI00202F06AF|nr:DUF2971 domain-containing protein [Flavobacterium tyrosinilyticum]MCM0666385.1 DUF2971 domain-containing protein [Flavobacterium tyrosinilyticum]